MRVRLVEGCEGKADGGVRARLMEGCEGKADGGV